MFISSIEGLQGGHPGQRGISSPSFLPMPAPGAVSAALGECEGLTETLSLKASFKKSQNPKFPLIFQPIPQSGLIPVPSDSARPCRELTTSLESPASLGGDSFTCLCWCSSSHLWVRYPQVLGFVLPNPPGLDGAQRSTTCG